MELSVRLQAVADMVSKGRRVADIGCDHGYVSIYLIRKKQCEKVIAMDVNPGPLERAQSNIRRFGLTDYIETRLSDGTNALEPGEADTLLLSGVGGRLTIRILEEGFMRLGQFEELILQPQSEIHLVRGFLREQGYSIADEELVLDEGKFYQIIKAQPIEKTVADAYGEWADISNAADSEPYSGRPCSSKPCSTGQTVQMATDYFGPILLKKRPAVLEHFLQREKEKTKSILAQITDAERKRELEAYLTCVEFALTGQ